MKSPVRENRSPGSVRGAPGNRRPYRDPLHLEGTVWPLTQRDRGLTCVNDEATVTHDSRLHILA